MKIALINNNKVENIILADASFAAAIQAEWQHVEDVTNKPEIGIGYSWTAAGGFTAPPALEAPASPIIPQPRRITRLAFQSRFTDAEAIAIDLASIGATVAAASIRRYLSKVDTASFIDLDRADTRVGVQALETIGLISAGRATLILDNAVTPEEMYKGM